MTGKVPGLTPLGTPLEVLVSQLTGLADIEALYQQAKFAFLEHRASLWTKLEYSRCVKRSCGILFWIKRNNWRKAPETSWVECDIGMDKNVGWYWGKDDALSNLPACIQAHIKAEFDE